MRGRCVGRWRVRGMLGKVEVERRAGALELYDRQAGKEG